MTIPPTADHRAGVDGKQFEAFVADVLRSLGDGLDDFRLEEQELVVADDGRYRIEEYAQKHGIALVRVLEGALTYETRAAGMERMPPPPWANIPPLVAQYISESKPGTIRVTVLQPDTQADLVEFLTTR